VSSRCTLTQQTPFFGKASPDGPQPPPPPLSLPLRLHADLAARSLAVSAGDYDGSLSQMIRS